MEKRAKTSAFVAVCVSAALMATAVGCSGIIAGKPSTDGGVNDVGTELTTAVSTNNMEDWIKLYPAEYYSFMSGADDMDDMGGFITKTGGPHSHANLYQNFMIRFTPEWESIGSGLFEKSTCISCKGEKFDEWVEEDGMDVYYDRYNEKYPNATAEQDVWSCNTCHSDINDPAGTVGAQISTFGLFGASLADKLAPGSAACAQCHNGLGAYNNLRNLDGRDLENESVDAYQYGTDPENFIKAFVEFSSDTGEQPGGKVWVDKDLGIYRYSITHPDIELFYGGNHNNLGLECADCHMSSVRTNMGGGYTKEDYETGQYDSTYKPDAENMYTSHDASGSPLDSYSALSGCLDCHKAQGVESAEDMVAYVKDAQSRFSERYAEVNAKGTECLEVMKSAIVNSVKDEATLDKARSDYALATTYLMFANGAPEEVGEKIAHSPEVSFEYCDRANALYEDVIALLS